MPSASPLAPGQMTEGPVRKWYTGKTINATKTSRTALAQTSVSGDNVLQVGDVVIVDNYGHDKGKGMDVTRPTANHLTAQAFVVTGIGQDETGNPTNVAGAGGKKDDAGTNVANGWIECVPYSEAMLVHTKAANNVAGSQTFLGLVAEQFWLVSLTSVANITAILTIRGRSLDATDTSTTDGKTLVQFGLFQPTF